MIGRPAVDPGKVTGAQRERLGLDLDGLPVGADAKELIIANV